MQTHIDSAEAYAEVLHQLNRQQGSPSLLHSLMNRLETYRQQRKLGWSRPWNKHGITTFQSFRLQTEDHHWLEEAVTLLKALNPPADAITFADALLSDPAWMGFLFFSETVDKGQLYESATLSLGRRAKINSKQRDRLDLRWDIPLRPDGENTERYFHAWVDPLRIADSQPLWSYSEATFPQAGHALLQRLADTSWQWHDNQQRLWDHWTSRYIDYFGDRRYRPAACCFYLEGAKRHLPLAEATATA